MPNMVIGELIKKLQELQSKHGDIPVYCAEIFGGGFGKMEDASINFYKKTEKKSGERYYIGESPEDHVGISL